MVTFSYASSRIFSITSFKTLIPVVVVYDFGDVSEKLVKIDIAQKLIFILKMVIKRLAVKTALTCYIGYGYFIKGFLLAEFFQ